MHVPLRSLALAALLSLAACAPETAPAPAWKRLEFSILEEDDTVAGAVDRHVSPIDETGFATVAGKTAADQAAWWVEAIVTLAASPQAMRIGIHEITDRTGDRAGETGDRKLALRRPPAFGTVRFLVDFLGADSVAVIDDRLAVETEGGSAGTVFHHAFLRPDRRRLLVVWSRGGPAVVHVRVRPEASRAVAYSLYGASAPYRRFDGKTLADLRLADGDVRLFVLEP
jgi:hypothetical protein